MAASITTKHGCSANGTSSETTPLLGNTEAVTDNGTLRVLPSDPIPEDEGRTTVIDEENTPGAVVKRTPLGEGLPDVKKKMWALLPALGIGVCAFRCSEERQEGGRG